MPEVITVGETMLAFAPTRGGIADASEYRAAIAGGESNVAIHLVRHGRTASWASRVGDDPAGRRIVSELAARGVDTSTVAIDADSPTGIMLKDPGAAGTTVHYYRAGSAASRLAPGFLPASALTEARLVHVTGVTPALSTSCAAMVDALFDDAAEAGVTVSFDVNHRPRLWQPGVAAPTLAALARRADICFVGRDEAEALWGVATADDIRAFLPEPRLLVVKDGDLGATAFEEGNPPVFEAALRVEVVEPVGAGDAFAGGTLAGLLRGAPLDECLRLGHATAAEVLILLDDIPPLEVAGP